MAHLCFALTVASCAYSANLRHLHDVSRIWAGIINLWSISFILFKYIVVMAIVFSSSDTLPLISVAICCTRGTSLNMLLKDRRFTLGIWTEWPTFYVFCYFCIGGWTSIFPPGLFALACWGSRSGLRLGPLLIGPEECILRRMSFPMFPFWKFYDLCSVACPPRGWMLDGWTVKVTF